MITDGQTGVTKNSRFSQFYAPNKEPVLSIFSHTQKAPITHAGNFVENRPFAVVLIQADGKQMNKIFAICFETRILETEINREKQVV